jgi:hypothetical protein
MVMPVSLVDSTGAAAGFTLTMDANSNSSFNTSVGNANGATTYTYTNAAGVAGQVLPSSASANSLFGNTEAFGGQTNRNPVLTFGGLSTDFTYTFTVFASRVSVADVRSGLYTATGLNSDSGVLDASNNSTVAIHLRDIVPAANGTITFSMLEAGTNTSANSFVYLNALMITSTASAIPEPGSFAALAGLGALGVVALRRRARSPAAGVRG